MDEDGHMEIQDSHYGNQYLYSRYIHKKARILSVSLAFIIISLDIFPPILATSLRYVNPTLLAQEKQTGSEMWEPVYSMVAEV